MRVALFATCLVDALYPDAGRATVLGGRYRDMRDPGRRVGILLDASAQHAQAKEPARV